MHKDLKWFSTPRFRQTVTGTRLDDQKEMGAKEKREEEKALRGDQVLLGFYMADVSFLSPSLHSGS